MNQTILENSFLEYLQGKGLDLQGLSLVTFPHLFIEYFQTIKFERFNQRNDGDMLLFQCGNFDWGKGRFFEVNFTRQLYEIFADESHQILQFGITFYYDSESFSNTKSFNKWSCDFQNLEHFQQFIIKSEPFLYATSQTQEKIEVFVDLV